MVKVLFIPNKLYICYIVILKIIKKMVVSTKELKRLKDMAYMKRLSYAKIAVITGVSKGTIYNFLNTGSVLSENRQKITSCIENYETEKSVA